MSSPQSFFPFSLFICSYLFLFFFVLILHLCMKMRSESPATPSPMDANGSKQKGGKGVKLLRSIIERPFLCILKLQIFLAVCFLFAIFLYIIFLLIGSQKLDYGEKSGASSAVLPISTIIPPTTMLPRQLILTNENGTQQKEEIPHEQMGLIREMERKLQMEIEKNAKLELELLLQRHQVKIEFAEMPTQMQIDALKSVRGVMSSQAPWRERPRAILRDFSDQIALKHPEMVAADWNCIFMRKFGELFGAAFSTRIKHKIFFTFDNEDSGYKLLLNKSDVVDTLEDCLNNPTDDGPTTTTTTNDTTTVTSTTRSTSCTTTRTTSSTTIGPTTTTKKGPRTKWTFAPNKIVGFLDRITPFPPGYKVKLD